MNIESQAYEVLSLLGDAEYDDLSQLKILCNPTALKMYGFDDWPPAVIDRAFAILRAQYPQIRS